MRLCGDEAAVCNGSAAAAGRRWQWRQCAAALPRQQAGGGSGGGSGGDGGSRQAVAVAAAVAVAGGSSRPKLRCIPFRLTSVLIVAAAKADLEAPLGPACPSPGGSAIVLPASAVQQQRSALLGEKMR